MNKCINIKKNKKKMLQGSCYKNYVKNLRDKENLAKNKETTYS